LFCSRYFLLANFAVLKSLPSHERRHLTLRTRSLTKSKIKTILIVFRQSHYHDFKTCYCEQVLKNGRSKFLGLVSYTHFVKYTPPAVVPLMMCLPTYCLGSCTGISFVNSTSLDGCLNHRIHRLKVFAGLAAREKTSFSWFFGFVMHLVINDNNYYFEEYIYACHSAG
jgi:hypothetical protein